MSMTGVLNRPSASQKRQYQDEGYFILTGCIASDELRALQEETLRFIDDAQRKHDAGEYSVNVANQKFFINDVASKSHIFRDFAFGEQMAEVVKAAVGDEAYLFYDQLVVKGPDKGQSFAWHQDSGYVDTPHKPYVTCWVALDDMSVANGTAYVLPYSRAGTRELVPHRKDEKTTERIGYFGSDPGEPVIVPAGSMAVFSSVCFHRSGANSTHNFRRAYVVQYSPEPILDPATQQVGRAEPFILAGQRTGQRS